MAFGKSNLGTAMVRVLYIPIFWVIGNLKEKTETMMNCLQNLILGR